MSWLQEFENQKRKSDEQKRNREKLFRSEFVKLDRIVTKVLRDVGDAYWGRTVFRLFARYSIKKDIFWGRWKVGISDSVYFKVELKPHYFEEVDPKKFYFQVYYGKIIKSSGHPYSASVSTDTTSENELKEAFKIAVGFGPCAEIKYIYDDSNNEV